MAFLWITLHAHHRHWVTQIQNPVQISAKVRGDHAFVVPLPDRLPRSRLQRAGANISRDAPLSKMKISDASGFQSLLQIAFA
jgi:hypothetical protein